MKSKTHPDEENPGKKAFTVNGIPMTAKSEQEEARIRETMEKFKSFLTHGIDGFRINWETYFAVPHHIHKRFTEVLLAVGMVSFEELGNFRVCEADNHGKFLGPTFEGQHLFFHTSMYKVAIDFRNAKMAHARNKSIGPVADIHVVQVIKMPTHIVIDQ